MNPKQPPTDSFLPFWTQPPEDESFLQTLVSCFSRETYPRQVFEAQIWGDPDFTPELCLLIRRTTGWGFAMGVLRERNGQRIGYVKMLAVSPSCRRQGLGTQLVKALENRLYQAGAGRICVAGSAPFYLEPGLDPRYTEAWVLFEKLGYRNMGHCFNLKVELASLLDGGVPGEDRGPASEITFRRAEPSDRTKVRQFLLAHWPTWQYEVELAFTNRPISLHLALANGRLLGFSGYDCNHKGIGWFGPMGTVPDARGKGIGHHLLLACLADMKGQGKSQSTIPWVGPVGFYLQKVGARIDRVFFRCEKDRLHGGKPESP